MPLFQNYSKNSPMRGHVVQIVASRGFRIINKRRSLLTDATIVIHPECATALEISKTGGASVSLWTSSTHEPEFFCRSTAENVIPLPLHPRKYSDKNTRIGDEENDGAGAVSYNVHHRAKFLVGDKTEIVVVIQGFSNY